MKFLALALTLCTPAFASFNFPPSARCRVPSDCTVVEGSCGWEVVNREAASQKSAELPDANSGSSCAVPPQKPEADCISGACFPKFVTKVDEDSECRMISTALVQIFYMAAKCREDKDCTQSHFEPLYQCRTAFNKNFEASARLSLLNRFHEHCASVHKSGFDEESRCGDAGWTAKCKNSLCVAVSGNN